MHSSLDSGLLPPQAAKGPFFSLLPEEGIISSKQSELVLCAEILSQPYIPLHGTLLEIQGLQAASHATRYKGILAVCLIGRDVIFVAGPVTILNVREPGARERGHWTMCSARTWPQQNVVTQQAVSDIPAPSV